MSGIVWDERHLNHRLVGQTNLFSFSEVNIDYVVFKLDSLSLSTKFGDYEQGKATISDKSIKYSAVLTEKGNHIPLTKKVKIHIEIDTHNGDRWLENLQNRELREMNQKPMISVSDTMKVLSQVDISAGKIKILLIVDEKEHRFETDLQFVSKLQWVHTKDVGHENNLWFKGTFSNGKRFELNLYSKPILTKE